MTESYEALVAQRDRILAEQRTETERKLAEALANQNAMADTISTLRRRIAILEAPHTPSNPCALAIRHLLAMSEQGQQPLADPMMRRQLQSLVETERAKENALRVRGAPVNFGSGQIL